MPSLKLNVGAEMSDFLLPDLPYVRRQEFDEIVGVSYDQASAAFTNAPCASLTTIQAFVIQPDRDIDVRLGGASVSTRVLAGGVLVGMNLSLDNTTGNGIVIGVVSGTAQIRLVALGT